MSNKDLDIKKVNVIDLMREVLELEQVVKNTLVLLVNYENNLFSKDSKGLDISVLDLKFAPFMVEFLGIHNKLLDLIQKNEKVELLSKGLRGVKDE